MIKTITPIVILMITGIGCAHHQLGYQTVHQAHTVADVHTQQVLDNLAKFVHNRNALPHFSYPSQGSSEVNGKVAGSVSLNFLPSALSNWNIGANGDRGMRENYTMTPINDPRKLELMRCAYQRAVSACCYGAESANCPNCEKRFNQFYLGKPDPKDSPETFLGWNVYNYEATAKEGKKSNGKLFAVISAPVVPNDPNSATITYYDRNTGERIEESDLTSLVLSMRSNTLADYTAKTGNITSECLYSPCWFYVGCRKDVPKCCAYVGKYCDTYIWVPESGVDELTKLTITILNFALYEDAKPASPSKKTVEYYLNENGQPASVKDASFKVSASIGVNDDVRTLTRSPNVELGIQPRSIELQRKNIGEIKANKAGVDGARLEKAENTLDFIERMPPSIPEDTEALPTQQPTRLPMPSLLEIDQQLRNISPAPAR